MPTQRDDSYTLIGAGLVGSLLAKLLADQGNSVTVFEKRADPRKNQSSAGRSINLALSHRGIRALRMAGLEQEVLKICIPMRGRMIHPIQGPLSFQPYGKDQTEYINSISRAQLNHILIDSAEKTGKVQFRFESPVTHVDIHDQTLQIHSTFEKDLGKLSFERLIGTDGSNSVLRNAFKKNKDYHEKVEVLDYGYKELTLLPAQNGGFQLDANSLHIWPRGTYMLIALPNLDGSFTCTLFLPMEGKQSFSAITSTEKIARFFGESFSDVLPLLPGLNDQFLSHPTGNMLTLKASRWNHGEKILLLGDAAHAIVPFFGQGMNCGFEDCAELIELLKTQQNGRHFEKLFELRKPNADAIADMAVENFIEMRDKVADREFVFTKAVEKVIQNQFPKRYRSRYSLVSFSQVPYQIAMQAGKMGDQILSELCAGLDRPENVDLAKADRLLREKMDGFLDQWLSSN